MNVLEIAGAEVAFGGACILTTGILFHRGSRRLLDHECRPALPAARAGRGAVQDFGYDGYEDGYAEDDSDEPEPALRRRWKGKATAAFIIAAVAVYGWEEYGPGASSPAPSAPSHPATHPATHPAVHATGHAVNAGGMNLSPAALGIIIAVIVLWVGVTAATNISRRRSAREARTARRTAGAAA